MIYAIVLNKAYAENMAAFLDDYLLPASARLDGHPVIYASAIDYTPLGMVATAKDRSKDFEADIHLPHGAVALVVSATSRNAIGFLVDAL